MAETSDRPIEQKLRYGSHLHAQIATRLRQRRHLSEREISRRYDDWQRVDEHLQMYLDLKRGARRGDKSIDPNEREMPFERSIVIPMSYAILQVRLTAIMAIFMAREPMIQLRGRAPEDVNAARLMESVLAYDLQESAALLSLYAAFQSAEKYGIGILADSWETEYGWVTNRVQIPGIPQEQLEALGRMAGIQTVSRGWGLQREYNMIRPVDPFYYWPDPRVRGHEVQLMEFIGDRVFRGFTQIESRSQANGGLYFNLEAVRQLARAGEQGFRGVTQHRTSTNRFNMGDTADELDRGTYALDQFQVNLIPKEWGLGSESRPEKWRFVLVEDQVIIRAHREPYEHEQFSYSVMQPNYDAFNVFTNGVIEDMDGLQRIANWMFNSHYENVRRFLNDSFVYDPALIEEDDLLNPGPARHIRITQLASEMIQRGMLQPNQLLTQLPLVDVTREHLKEIEGLLEMSQRMSGVNDPAMGQPLPGRRTLGEVENVIFSSSRRMALTAQLYDMQAISPLAKRLVANRQQFMSREEFFEIIGEENDPMGIQQVLINRQQILGNYNYVPVSGVTPPDPARFSETWIQLMGVMAQLPPEIIMQYDLGEFVKEIAKGLGVKNLDRFKLQTPPQVNVMPDAEVASGAADGSLVPVNQPMSMAP